MKKFLVLGFLLGSIPLMAVNLVGGSDGPTPFSKISHPGLSSIATQSSVTSFAVLEKSDEVAYVDPKKNLHLHNLKNGEEIGLGTFFSKLLPFTDFKEKYLLSNNRRVLKNIENYGNDREVQLPVASRFLFWEKEELYLLRKLESVSSLKWKIDFYLFKAEKNLVEHKSCEFILSSPRKELVVGDGHRFPHLLLYSPPAADEEGLMLFYLDLRPRKENCSLKALPETRDLISGQIQSVTQLSPYHDMVVITDHSDKNLYFGKPGKWRYASLPGGTSYLPNPRSSMVVNLNRQRGISIYSLKTQKYFNLDLSVDENLMARDQIWVSTNGDRFYINTREESSSTEDRSLFQLDLNKINSDG